MRQWKKCYSHGCIEALEVTDLCTKDEVAELRERQEDDEEHDSEASKILGTTSQGRWQLRHRLVEADVLEHLWTQWKSYYNIAKIQEDEKIFTLYIYASLQNKNC